MHPASNSIIRLIPSRSPMSDGLMQYRVVPRLDLEAHPFSGPRQIHWIVSPPEAPPRGIDVCF